MTKGIFACGFRFLSGAAILIGCVCAVPVMSSPLGAEDTKVIQRQILIVPNPSRTSVTGVQIAAQEKENAEVARFLELIGPAIGIRKILVNNIAAPSGGEKAAVTEPAVETLLENYLLATYESVDDATRALDRLQQSELVLSAAPNIAFHLSTTYLDQTPVYTNLGTYQWGTNALSPINAPAAWSLLGGFAQVGSVDNGIYWEVESGALSTHKDLAENFRIQFSRAIKPNQDPAGQSFVALDGNVNEQGAKGHGTHVAGLIAANPPTNSPTGMRGSCPTCGLTMMRVEGEAAGEDAVGAMFLELVTGGVQVVNLSLGFSASGGDGGPRPPDYCSNYPSTFMCLALTLASNRGVSVIASSGNNQTAIDFPANQSSVIAVGGLEKVGASYAFWTTGYGVSSGPCPQGGVGSPESGSNCSDATDIAAGKYQVVAPALDILSTFFTGATYFEALHCGDQYDPIKPLQAGNQGFLSPSYGTCTGTSMSAPVVSGLVGLARSANPLLGSQDTNAILKRRSSGAGSVIDANFGWGYPLAKELVVAALSGANISNPNLYDIGIKNRTTPLFSLYSSQGRNHYYTVAPQGGSAAISGTLKPSPQYKLGAASYSAGCTPGMPGSCKGAPVSIVPAIRIKKPDGTNATSGISVEVTNSGSGPGSLTNPAVAYVLSSSGGNVAVSMTWDQIFGGGDITRSTTFLPIVHTSYPLTYNSVGNLISGYSVYPGINNITIHPGSFVSTYVSHVNPIAGGPDLLPLYRLSRRCGDFASPICDSPGASNYNPFHVSHAYTTDKSERAALIATPSNYKFDGIDGYVFPRSYASAPIAGAVKLCRLRDPVRDELVLFPGSGTGGAQCNPPFPSYASGSYYSDMLGTADWLGWVVPNCGGNTPPTVSLTSPSNGATFSPGATITLSANASDSNGIASVKWFANGAQVASDNTSPYSKTWTAPSTPGAYKIYAVAADNASSSAQATSNPATIQVICPSATPAFANASFETPVVGSGNYDDAPAGASWTFVPVWGGGQSGISGNNSAFTSGNPNAPAGSQVAFIQGQNYVSQQICIQSAGSYHVRLLAAQRYSYNNGGLELGLYVDGNYIGVVAVANTVSTYVSKDSPSFTVAAGLHTIELWGYNPSGLDNSIFIDQVQLVSP